MQNWTNYSPEIKKLVNCLALDGSPLTQNEHIEATSDGFEDEYESLITSMMAKVAPYTVEELEKLLMAQEERFYKNKKCCSEKISENIAEWTECKFLL